MKNVAVREKSFWFERKTGTNLLAESQEANGVTYSYQTARPVQATRPVKGKWKRTFER